MKRYVTELERCPNCGDEWAYEADGNIYSRVIAIYSREQDRTVGWRCPACGNVWERGAQIDGSPCPECKGRGVIVDPWSTDEPKPIPCPRCTHIDGDPRG